VTIDLDATNGCDCVCDKFYGGCSCEILFDQPTSSPSTFPTWSQPSTSPTYSLPSTSPATELPSQTPSTAPTTDIPSQVPTVAPVKEALLVWISESMASESNTGVPHIDIVFMTTVNKPWKLDRLTATGDDEVVQHIVTFEELDSEDCQLRGEIQNCQTWHLYFETTRNCDNHDRIVDVSFVAVYKDASTFEEIHIPLELGGSSALECAAELGEFGLTSDVFLSKDNVNYVPESSALMFESDGTVYMRIVVNSGHYPIEDVSLDDLTIYSNSVPAQLRCDAECETELEYAPLPDISDNSLTFSFVLKTSIFPQEEVLAVNVRLNIKYVGLTEGTTINLLTHLSVTNP